MFASKQSSINMSRYSKRNTITSGEDKSTIGRGAPTIVPPKVNASNNINGDELFKVHTAFGGFKCPGINCVACIYQVQ